MKKYKITMSELEMQLLLETVEKTPYLGVHSYLVSGLRKKLKITPDNPGPGEKDKQ